MKTDSRLFLLVLALAIFACGGVLPPTGATVTPTGQIGAVEIGTPGLKGNKKNFQIWTGTITSRTSRQYMSNGAVANTCNTNWLTDLEFAVPLMGASSAEAQINLSGVLTGCGGSKDDTMNNRSLVKLEFRFKCSDIPADISDTALEKLCQ